jgi:hypothetical protein
MHHAYNRTIFSELHAFERIARIDNQFRVSDPLYSNAEWSVTMTTQSTDFTANPSPDVNV